MELLCFSPLDAFHPPLRARERSSPLLGVAKGHLLSARWHHNGSRADMPLTRRYATYSHQIPRTLSSADSPLQSPDSRIATTVATRELEAGAADACGSTCRAILDMLVFQAAHLCSWRSPLSRQGKAMLDQARCGLVIARAKNQSRLQSGVGPDPKRACAVERAPENNKSSLTRASIASLDLLARPCLSSLLSISTTFSRSQLPPQLRDQIQLLLHSFTLDLAPPR